MISVQKAAERERGADVVVKWFWKNPRRIREPLQVSNTAGSADESWAET